MKKQTTVPKRSSKKLVIALVVIIVLAGVIAGFIYFHNANNRGKFNHSRGQWQNSSRMGGNFQLNQTQISDISSFFNSNPSSDQISSYCLNNRGACFYYCRNVNSNLTMCSQMQRPRNFTG